MERYRGVQKRRGPTSATNVAKRLAPRQGPSPRPELYDIEPPTSAMASSTTDPPSTFLQVVDDVIDLSLIDNAVKTLGSESAREGISTELQWTDACDVLWRTYVGHVHSNVINRPEIATFVKPYTETQRTFKTIMRFNPILPKFPSCSIPLPTDYHIIIPLVLEGLPRWAEHQSTKERQKVPWKKGSVVCIKGGTTLICTEEGGGIYMIGGGETKKQL